MLKPEINAPNVLTFLSYKYLRRTEIFQTRSSTLYIKEFIIYIL